MTTHKNSPWEKALWGDIISLEYGKALRNYSESGGSIKVYGTNGPVGWTIQPLCKGPGIILGRKGAYRGVHFSQDPFFVIDTAYYVVPKINLDIRWLYYAIKHSKLGEIDDGSPIPSTTRSAVYVNETYLPSYDEQKSIANILGTLDDKIDLNRRMNETLEAITRAIFKDWFVDFGPTRAKMEGRPPYLTPELWALFPDRLSNNGLPVGWEMGTLAEVTSEIRRGISPSYVEQEGIVVLNQKCIRNRQVLFGSSRLHDSTKRSVEGRYLTAGDILINSTGVGTLGRVAQIWNINRPTVVDSHITLVRPDITKTSLCYLGLNISGRESEIEALGEGSTGQTELARSRIAALPLLHPSMAIQAAFEDIVLPLILRAIQSEIESVSLAYSRDILLPKLMTGEVRVNVGASS